MDREQSIMLRAIRDDLDERLDSLRAGLQPAEQRISLAPPQIVNKVAVPSVKVVNEVAAPQVVVQVDMAPVAEALERMTAALAETHGLLARLLTALAGQPAPVFSPTVQVPAPVVTVEAPQVHVAAPQVTVESPARRKRRLKIAHDDGSTSTVTEE